MTIEEALTRIKALSVRKNLIDPYTYQSGKISIDHSRFERGLHPCFHCGALAYMGIVTVWNADGRTVSFSPQLFHYVEAGHPITDEDVNRDLLLGIMSNP